MDSKNAKALLSILNRLSKGRFENINLESLETESTAPYQIALRHITQRLMTLQKDEMQHRAVIETATDAIIIIDVNGIIQFCNPATTKLLGYTQKELVGRNVSTLMPDTIAKSHNQYLKTHLETGIQKVIGIGREVIAQKKNNTPIDLLLSVSKLKIEGKIYFSGFLHDITKQKQAQAQLALNEEKMKNLVNTAIDSIIVINEKGIIESANNATQEMFGFDTNFLIGKNISILMPEPFHSEHDQYLKNYQKTHRRKIIGVGREIKACKKDGSEFHAHLSVSEFKIDNKKLFTGILRDISIQKEQEKILQQRNFMLSQENQLKELTNQFHEKMKKPQATKEITEAAFVFFVENFSLLIGACYRVANNQIELIGQFALSEKQKKSKNIFQMGEGLVGEVIKQKKNFILSKNIDNLFFAESGIGQIKPSRILMILISYQGEIIGLLELGLQTEESTIEQRFFENAAAILGVALEGARAREKATELLQKTLMQEEELRVSNEELQEKMHLVEKQREEIERQKKDIEKHAEHLAANNQYKSEFLANMSHELRTPLNSLLLLCAGLAKNREGNLHEEQVEDIHVIQKSGELLLTLINDILDLSKVEAGKLEIIQESISFSSLIENLKEQFLPVAEKKSLRFIIENEVEDKFSFFSDPLRVEQILRNLLSNAFKFTQDGYVKIILKELNSSGTKKIQFVVEDTGIGIPTEKQKEIFQAFQQADGSTARHYGGTGLGLTISEKLAHLLNGHIYLASSEKNKGSCFILELPWGNARTKLSSGENKKSDAIPHKKAVLLIEDDHLNQHAITRLIEKAGFSIEIAENGENALFALEKNTFDCVILDYELPDMSGLALLKEIKNRKKSTIPNIVVYTGKELSKEEYLELNHFTQTFIVKGNKSADRLLDEINLFLHGVDASKHLEKKSEKSVPKASSRNKNALQGASVMLVDDNLRNSFALSKELRREGIDVIVVDSGKLAIEKLTALKRVDMILMDIMMPDMDGYETMQYIRNQPDWKTIPMIALTAKVMTGDKQKCLQAGANDYIPKPINLDKLLDVMRIWVEKQ